MRKTIFLLSIVAAAIAVLALAVGVVLLTVFWEPASAIYATNREIIAAGPVIPLGNLFSVVACLAIAIVTCIVVKASNSYIFEIIAIALLSVAIPLVTAVLLTVQTAIMGTQGVLLLSTLNVSITVSSFALRLLGVAQALCLVVCGMSIVDKVYTQKLTRAQFR